MELVIASLIIFGFPIALLLGGIVMSTKKRKWKHMERMKMIENGLLLPDDEPLDKKNTFEWSELLFFMQSALQFLLVIMGLVYIVVIQVVAPNNSVIMGLVTVEVGILLTFFFTIAIKLVPLFRPYRLILLLGSFMFSLLWIIMLLDHFANVPWRKGEQHLLKKHSYRIERNINPFDC